jgi:DNA-binding FrmR family transcriptional regulator
MTKLASQQENAKPTSSRDQTMKPPVRGYASGKKDYLTRLGKIEGQVRGIRKMVEEDKWCPDIVTQVSAANRALQEVAIGLLKDHLDCCVVDAVRRSAKDGHEAIEEVVSTIRQVVKL